MQIEPWLPHGFVLPDSTACGRPRHDGHGWQIIETRDGGSALLAEGHLARRWLSAGLFREGQMLQFEFGHREIHTVSGRHDQCLDPVTECRSPQTTSEALAFAHAIRETRLIEPDVSLADALYVERFSRLLPTYSPTARIEDDVLLGLWLTGGAPVSASNQRRLRQMLTWLSPEVLQQINDVAGVITRDDMVSAGPATGIEPKSMTSRQFLLPGRLLLQSFLQEHVIDILHNREHYRRMGIGFPGAIVLYGPPGCGKTFAVERLVEYLGWPSYRIEASTVASPYIHETSRKVADVFTDAVKTAPSVLVIDEMEAFLSSRETVSGQHHVEEVAEFLRRIPEASKNEVLVVAMTNRLDMIDQAILRRGRFDHIIEVPPADQREIEDLLRSLASGLPVASQVDFVHLAARLAGRPLSDVSFVLREAARQAARQGASEIGVVVLDAALDAATARGASATRRRIGFS